MLSICLISFQLLIHLRLSAFWVTYACYWNLVFNPCTHFSTGNNCPSGFCLTNFSQWCTINRTSATQTRRLDKHRSQTVQIWNPAIIARREKEICQGFDPSELPNNIWNVLKSVSQSVATSNWGVIYVQD